MKMKIPVRDIISGLLIFSTGDTIAAIIQDDFMWSRLLGIALTGALLYALEIPAYFKWIDKVTLKGQVGKIKIKTAIIRMSLAQLFFNPLWIARHMLFIHLFTGNYSAIQPNLIISGSISFLYALPVTLIVNYLTQNLVGVKYRFIVTALFSAIIAVYYAMSAVWFV
jgi:hypothetical protein